MKAIIYFRHRKKKVIPVVQLALSLYERTKIRSNKMMYKFSIQLDLIIVRNSDPYRITMQFHAPLM